jgi:hypothetical protein
MDCISERCHGRMEVVDDNGVTDPANGARIEKWECQTCGETIQKTLTP